MKLPTINIILTPKRAKRPRLPACSPRATRIQRRRPPFQVVLAGAALALASWIGVVQLVARDAPAPQSPGGAAHPAPRLPDGLAAVPSYPVDARFAVDGDHFVLISKDAKRLVVYRKVRDIRIATGLNPGDKQRVGDCRTPVTPPGKLFTVARKLVTPEGSEFGPRFVGLSAPPWHGIAIHGTNDPASIGTDASHGCVRMENDDIRWLFDRLKIGEPVVIRP